MRTALLTVALLASAAAPASAADRPNIVFVLVDDLRWDALGCTGHPWVKTPHIDRIAREGAVFRDSFVTTPLCSPSRASFLTGRYVHSHGVKGNADNAALSHKLVTWPRLLHDAGYETAYVGKWHMGNDASPRPGFDRWVSFRGQGVFENPPLNIDGKPVETQGYMTDLLTDHAVEFVKRPRTKPFALCLAHKAVHGPFTPAERHKALYADDQRPELPSFKDDWEGKPALKAGAQKKAEAKPKAKAKAAPGGGADRIMREQLRCLTSIDDGVGKLLAALGEAKQLDNTLFIFTSDNGYFWGEHRLGDKRAAYEESIRIPLVMRYPKRIRAGFKTDEMAINLDVAPTCLDAAGVKVPGDMEGRSLLSLAGGAADWRKAFLAEYYEEPAFPHIPTWQAVRTDRWKYIHYPGLPDADELYDLKLDAYEMTNLVKDPAARETLKELRGELGRLAKGDGK